MATILPTSALAIHLGDLGPTDWLEDFFFTNPGCFRRKKPFPETKSLPLKIGRAAKGYFRSTIKMLVVTSCFQFEFCRSWGIHTSTIKSFFAIIYVVGIRDTPSTWKDVCEQWYLISKDPPAWGCFSACFPTNPEESWTFENHPKTFCQTQRLLTLLSLKVGLGLLLYRV